MSREVKVYATPAAPVTPRTAILTLTLNAETLEYILCQIVGRRIDDAQCFLTFIDTETLKRKVREEIDTLRTFVETCQDSTLAGVDLLVNEGHPLEDITVQIPLDAGEVYHLLTVLEDYLEDLLDYIEAKDPTPFEVHNNLYKSLKGVVAQLREAAPAASLAE